MLGHCIIGIWRSEPGFFLGIGLLGAGFGMDYATFPPMAVNVVEPTRRGACNSTIILGQDIGAFLGYYLFGWAAQRFGSYSSSYFANGLLILIPLGLFTLFTLPDYLKKLGRAEQTFVESGE